MDRVKAAIVCLALLSTTPSAWAATEFLSGSDAAALLHTPTGSGAQSAASALDPSTWNLFGGRSSAQADEPFAFDATALATRVSVASERNPFALTVLLIAFAGLTAFFARKRSGGRGLISA